MGDKHYYTEFNTGAKYDFRDINHTNALKSKLQKIIDTLPEDNLKIDLLELKDYCLYISFFDPAPGDTKEVELD